MKVDTFIIPNLQMGKLSKERSKKVRDEELREGN